MDKSAKLEIGKKFVNTAKCAIVCQKHVRIGDNVTVSWDTIIMDSDFHDFVDNDGTTKEKTADIVIGNGVFIGMRSVVLKWSLLPDGCVVGAGTLVNRKFKDSNSLIVSNAAMIKRTGMTMKHD